jgi:hypothetical protein
MSASDQVVQYAYSTDGMSTAFAFPSYFYAQADLVVEYTDAGGVVTVKTFNSDYTVSGTLDDKLNTYNNGGTVNFGVAPVTGGTITITRKTAPTQLAVFNPQDPFSAGALEASLDRMTLVIQELAASITR